ncbi:mucin-associated surface protein [Acidiferrobacter sp. SPIII_3]|uniref:DNA-binding protein n=1 Tax=Acidiferrobacter sp. SPIII_3 TaxID=1281578 RepID=UPI000D73115A|nr:DNA-binding protein [Acidiferrobacter sp. SPIII_3]AWP24518.1 mucin-associated surface protein [Acidiferrobacter sp. SPIII_3]
MGRDATVTYEQVAGIADSIQAAGGKPTLRAVREQVGGGSMGTINKLLQEWRGAHERRTAGDLALPPALQRALLDFMGTEIAGARAPLEADIAEHQAVTADLAAENERQTETIRDLSLQIESVTADRAGIEGKAAQLTADLAIARDEITRERQAAEVARVELAKAALRLEGLPRLEAEITSLRADLERERQGRIQAERRSRPYARTWSGSVRGASRPSRRPPSSRPA